MPVVQLVFVYGVNRATERTLSESSSRAKGWHKWMARRIPLLRSDYDKTQPGERSACLPRDPSLRAGLRTFPAPASSRARLDDDFIGGGGGENVTGVSRTLNLKGTYANHWPWNTHNVINCWLRSSPEKLSDWAKNSKATEWLAENAGPVERYALPQRNPSAVGHGAILAPNELLLI